MLTALFRWPSFLRDAHGKVVGREDGVGVLVEDSRVGRNGRLQAQQGGRAKETWATQGSLRGRMQAGQGARWSASGCPRRLPWCRCGALVEVRGCT